ncbi:hypothetical protein B2G74_32985 [Burkholderia sp. A27]|nr:hypothetical protein B2G74_32985 [Burkholderia sp. A27]
MSSHSPAIGQRLTKGELAAFIQRPRRTEQYENSLRDCYQRTRSFAGAVLAAGISLALGQRDTR